MKENSQKEENKEIKEENKINVFPMNVSESYNSEERLDNNENIEYENKNNIPINDRVSNKSIKSEEGQKNKKKEINESKETFTLVNDNKLKTPKFLEKYKNQILSSYETLYDDNNQEKKNMYSDLINQYFNNQLIDENYVYYFTNKDTEKVKNSIMYQKYIIKQTDKSNQFKEIFNHMFCSFRLFNCLFDCFSFKTGGQILNDKNIKNESSKHLQYHNFWNFGLNLIFFEITGFFLISQVFIMLFLIIGYQDENKTSFEWERFSSNQYKCLQLQLNDLLNENYSFNITCVENKNFFYISKFGISSINEEGVNIAGCFSSSFKNLINTDPDCDLSRYLDNKLEEYKFKEANIEINIKEMNIANEILNNCKNKNQRQKFFLSYSCYIPYIKKDNENKKRSDLIGPIIFFESILFFLNYLSLFYHSIKFSKAMRQNNIKNITLKIDTLNIEREKIPHFLNELLISIKNKLLSLNIINQNDSYYSMIKEINYSFLNSEEKDLYDKLNYLLRKRVFLLEKINTEDKDKPIPRNLILTILSKIFCCLSKTYFQEFEKTEKDLKEILDKIYKRKESDYELRKIYITFSNYEIKSLLKNQKILIENEYHILKKCDMSPHDINWENLNVDKKKKLIRRIISYFLIVILLFAYFLIVIIISVAQNTFRRKYNILSDCSNVDYKNNNNLIYDEFINKEQNEKEKIYTYCYCQSELNNQKITYNEKTFDPCETYNKYNFQRTVYIYLLSAVLVIFNLFIDIIVDKIISIQQFESKSNQKNLNIATTIIILIFTNIVSVVVINAKIKDSNISDYFGIYEDITPQWINEMSENILANLYSKIGVNILLNLIYITLFAENRCCYNKPIYYYILFLLDNPIIHFYDYFKIYAPEKNYVKYSTITIFFLFNAGILIFLPIHALIASICLMIQAILFLSQNSFLYSFTYVLNKIYFKMIFILITIFLIFHTLLEIWWYSSEYFFIDINENVYNDFYGSNRDLIDKFLKGNASISEKIKVKLSLKRNIFFIIQLIVIIIMEIIRIFLFQKKKPKGKGNFDENLLQLDEYSKIKYYEFYKLLNSKISLLNLNDNESVKELYNFIQYKFNEYKNDALIDEELNDSFNKIIIFKKNKMIEEKNVIINNPDFTFSPFLLDQYSISFTSKFVLSPYYS